MGRGSRVTIVGLVLFAFTMLNGRISCAQASDATLGSSSENEARFQAWLNSSGLGKNFEIIRIGVGPQPDSRFALDGMIQHLELRFVTESSNRTEEAARFEKLLSEYQRDHASALPEKLLYEFVDTFAIEPRNACVDLHLNGVIFSIYSSRTDGSVVVSKGGGRADYDAFSVTIPAVVPQEQFRAHLGKESAPDPNVVRDAVEKVLKSYLGSVQSKGGPTPQIVDDVHRQDGFLRMYVNGAKGMVTDGLWEWMDIAVFFHQEPSADKGNGSQWNFVCNVEVKYASNPRETHPKDADFDFASQVARFRTQLNQQLQSSLEKGIHD